MDLVNLTTGEMALDVPRGSASDLLARGYRDAATITSSEWLGTLQKLQPSTRRSSFPPLDPARLSLLQIEME